ncbi:MAG: efflux RND transporter permease subunit [Gammaproteobacteria bacterium]
MADAAVPAAPGGIIAWFVRRPVATTLITLAVILLGLAAFPRLPIAPLPDTDYPTLQVTANLPGASPETMASSVATPLEVAFSTIPGVQQMTSTSALGMTQVSLQFVLDKDIDTAAQEVQSAINTASGRLPEELPDAPYWRKVNPADGPVLVLRVQSDRHTPEVLSDLTETLLARQLTQLDGVGEIGITGQRRPALRVQVWPDRLAAAGLTLTDVRRVLQGANVNRPKGALFGARHTSTLATNDQLFDPGAYRRLVLAYRAGSPVLLGDVAEIVAGAENEYVQAWPNGRPGLNLIIRRQPGANVVATAERIKAALPALQAMLPAGIEVDVLNDRTRTIRASLAEVELALSVSVVLVIGVMGAFLRQRAATGIVTVVLAVSVLATLGAMYLAGFSLNNLTLVALVIAVGFVVDDAIVVIENIHRHLEAGASREEAALRGAREIAFTVLAISVSLVAAFIPLLFMGDVVGRLFREFALTVTIAVLVSALAALTLAPALAGRFMRPLVHDPHAGRTWPVRLADAYGRSVAAALDHPRALLAAFLVSVALAVAGYAAIPKGFFPLQDTAFLFGTTQAAEDIGYPEMVAKHQALARLIAADPAVQSFSHSVGATGGSQGMSMGRFWLVLKDRDQRDVSVFELIERLRPRLADVPGIALYFRAAQDINLGISAGPSRTQYQYALRSADSEALARWAQRLTERLQALPELRDVSNDLQRGARVTGLEIDRAAAARFGISVADIDDALYDAFGQRQVAEYQTETNQYKVILEIVPTLRGRADSLAYFHLRAGATGALVPLSALVIPQPPRAGPTTISHNGMFPAVTISLNLAPDVALGDAVRLIHATEAALGMPAQVTGRFLGTAQAFQNALATQPLLILAAVLAVYIILGVLYENAWHPLTILSTLPSAGIGALAFLWLAGFDFSIMALIGVVLLIGIVKKNGILLVDFALAAQRTQGLGARAAIEQACRVRFRPIMMTTIAAMLGAVPLMIGGGTGAELRQPLGYAVFGGLLVSQVLTLYTTPVVYLWLARWTGTLRASAADEAPQGR